MKCTALELQNNCYVRYLMLHALTLGEGGAPETDPEREVLNGHCSKNDLKDLQKLTNFLLVTCLVTWYATSIRKLTFLNENKLLNNFFCC